MGALPAHVGEAVEHCTDAGCRRVVDEALEHREGLRPHADFRTNAQNEVAQLRPVIVVVSDRHLERFGDRGRSIGKGRIDDAAQALHAGVRDQFDAVDQALDDRIVEDHHHLHRGRAVQQRVGDAKGDAHQSARHRKERPLAIHAGVPGFVGVHANRDAVGRLAGEALAQVEGGIHRRLVERTHRIGLEDHAVDEPGLADLAGERSDIAVGARVGANKAIAAFNGPWRGN